ncbi:MAG: ABC transporter permease [Clostridia bacterium]|nr:ABC transporter permease [Clostridia bacterium]
MQAILKREIKSYFNSPIAYVLLGLFTFICALFFYFVNIQSQSADFNPVFSTISFILIFIVPIMTMRILAEDRKNGTEVLLVSSPVSVWEIVLGKYLAMLVVFLIMTCIVAIFPIIIFMFGKPPIAPLLGSFIGFMLLGASLISIGVFASSLTENQVIAVFLSFVMMLVIWLVESIGNALGGWAANVLNWFSLTSRYNNFTSGLLDIPSAVYFLSFISVFLFLTMRVIEKRRWSQG